MSEQERRLFRRIETQETKVTAVIDGEERLFGTLSNVSRSGLFVATNQKPAPGTTLKCTLHTTNTDQPDLELASKVVRQVKPTATGKAGIGLLLTKPSQRYREWVSLLLNPTDFDYTEDTLAGWLPSANGPLPSK